MPYIYLLCAIVTSAGLAIAGTLFNQKNHHAEGLGGLYNAIAACSNFIVWLLFFCTDPSFDSKVLPYSVLYGVGYAVFLVGLNGALQAGSSALTGFIKQIAFVFVALWGFVFWNADPTVTILAGIILITVALFLCLVPLGKNAGKGTFRIAGKWLLYALMVLVGNAGCSIIQKTQQMHFDGQHGKQLMLGATLIAAICCTLMGVRSDKRNWAKAFKKYWYYPVIAGASSCICNFFIIMMASTTLSPSLIYPALAIGGLILTTLVSVVTCKEKLTPSQWVGLVVGAVALVFLNL